MGKKQGPKTAETTFRKKTGMGEITSANVQDDLVCYTSHYSVIQLKRIACRLTGQQTQTCAQDFDKEVKAS